MRLQETHLHLPLVVTESDPELEVEYPRVPANQTWACRAGLRLAVQAADP